MNPHRIILVLASLTAIIAAVMFVAPVKTLSAPAPPMAAPTTVGKQSLAPFAAKFDLANLPEFQAPEPVLPPPPPPHDPAQALKRYRFIGLATSELRGAGVFERDGQTVVLTPGMALEGFSLSSVDGEAARFEDETGTEARLPLETPALE